MKVLIVDDNVDFSATIGDIVKGFGYDVHIINEPNQAVLYLERQSRNIGLILLDIEFGPDADLNGLDLLEIIRRNFAFVPVVMISGKGTIESAVRATKLGAVNFIEKSVVNKEKIKAALDSAMSRLDAKGETADIIKFLNSQGIIGKSKAMVEVGDNIIRFGRTELNVLITGDTGSGKRLVAKAVHTVSRRSKQPFVSVDIPNIPKELFQSELFGHIKGAFSGASENKKGLFHEAHKGSLFLDEIGDLSLDLQSSLFIPIEEKVVRKVGSTQTENIDIRFISATDRDLIAAMKESKFREQLYHRLRECEIHIPSLEERAEDIPDIIEFYVRKHNDEFNESKYISPSSVAYLAERRWDGNVRELASVVKVALQTSGKEQIEIAEFTRILNSGGVKDASLSTAVISSDRTLKEDLAEVDKKKIETTLRQCNGNVSKSAALLDVSRETLHNKIRRYGINAQSFRSKATKE